MNLNGEGHAGRYVCAFRGRRDSYQVPLALAEANQLDQFITDLYYSSSLSALGSLLPAGIRERLRSRRQEEIPDDLVRSLWGITALEHARHRIGIAHWRTYSVLDSQYSLAARDRARQAKSNLFLYNPYAWEAFTSRYSHHPRRVLFQFHPHSDFEDRLLESDQRRHPETRFSSDARQSRRAARHETRREEDCWQHADLIICASSFTKKTLVEAGANPELCEVIQYGVDIPQRVEPDVPHGRFEALFVGSGVQRKGLHHLIRAWGAAKLPKGSRLTLICRNIDPALSEMMGGNDSIRLLRRVSEADLSALYRSSSLFIMPSLIEGFGQVFLEALAAGCPVLGTANTCLPDLGGEEDGIFLTEPGDTDRLTIQLEQFSRSLERLAGLREPARRCAGRFTWRRFRDQIIASLGHARAAAAESVVPQTIFTS